MNTCASLSTCFPTPSSTVRAAPVILQWLGVRGIRRGMYGLPQAGRRANDQLIAFLAPHGYRPVSLTPGLWHHDTKDIVFSLVVDDFGVRYMSRSDAEHLFSTLETAYQVSTEVKYHMY